ncbi:MAG: hypothetical protein ABGZ36_21735, partial [Actinomycetota bacterium]
MDSPSEETCEAISCWAMTRQAAVDVLLHRRARPFRDVATLDLFRDLAGSGSVALLSRSCADPVADSARHREVMRPLGLDAEVRL